MARPFDSCKVRFDSYKPAGRPGFPSPGRSGNILREIDKIRRRLNGAH